MGLMLGVNPHAHEGLPTSATKQPESDTDTTTTTTTQPEATPEDAKAVAATNSYQKSDQVILWLAGLFAIGFAVWLQLS